MARAWGECGFPDILAVKEDRQRKAGPNRQGARSPCDILSVYLKGGPRYRLDRRAYEFKPPIAMLIPQGTLDHDLQVGQVDGIYVLFRNHGLLKKAAGRINRLLVAFGQQRILAPFLKQLSVADADRIASLLRAIAGTGTRTLTDQLRRTALLVEAIADYCEAGTKAEGIHREAWRLRDIIEARAFANLPLETMYAGLSLSAAHAEKLFKAAFHVAPVTYRFQLRMKQARTLLVSSQLNVREVALAVGFTDPLYFSRLFRKTFRAAPSTLIRDFSSRRA